MTAPMPDLENWSQLGPEERARIKAQALWESSPKYRFYYDWREKNGDFNTSIVWGLDAADAEKRARGKMQWLDRFYELDPRWDAVILPGGECILRAEYERRLNADLDKRYPVAGLFREIMKAAE